MKPSEAQRPLHELDLEELPLDEFLRRCAEPVTQEAIEGTHELVAWFTRRYPAARERFAYVRQALARTLRRPAGGATR